jgi:hypothetical protein
MTRFVSSFSSRYIVVSLGLLWLTAGAAGQQPPSNKQLRQIQMFTLQQDGSLAEIGCETAAIDSERYATNTVANPQGIVSLARLPGGQAKIRYTEGQDVRIIALLPGSVDIGQIELMSFENRGKIRVSYLRPFRGGSGGNWNTHPVRARQFKDGRWLLEPTSQLGPGEYCFSPKFNNDNFCFGVDKK